MSILRGGEEGRMVGRAKDSVEVNGQLAGPDTSLRNCSLICYLWFRYISITLKASHVYYS